MYKISYKSLFETKTDWLNFTARFCFQVTLLIGLAEIISWIFGFRKLLTIREDFLPIAPDAAIIMFLLSSVLFYMTFNRENKTTVVISITLVSLIIIYVSLKIIEFFFRTDLTLSNSLFTSSENSGGFLIKRISPITCFLYILSGIASIVRLSEKLRKRYYNLTGITGSAVLITGFIITTGYSFGTPLFNIGNIIPVALPAAVGLSFIGLGILTAAGPDCIINKLYTGTSVKSLLIRSFIPIIILVVLLDGFIHQILELKILNQGILASITIFLFIAIAIIIAIKVAVKISKVINTAESERRKAEEKLKENLVEKETLLKELNHRVKNNFNLINSIIELSTQKINKADDLQESINIIKRRIYTISLIHRQLYDSKNYSDVNFRQYIIQLAETLLAAYDGEKVIKLHYNIDNIPLPITKAIPCGLIINELLTNSFKYAFNGKNSGNIFISFKNFEDSINLTIRDDGKGLPEKFSLDNSETMGYTIVRELSSQLDGKAEISSEDGAVFKLIFPCS